MPIAYCPMLNLLRGQNRISNNLLRIFFLRKSFFNQKDINLKHELDHAEKRFFKFYSFAIER